MAEQQIILGYWGVVGLGQALRYILTYVGANWKDQVYADAGKWFGTDKQGLGIPLPNLPYLIDGEFKLSESNALIRYIPRKFGKPELLGKTIQDQARVDQILGAASDINTTLMGALREEGWQNKKAEVYGKIKDKFEQIEKIVKQNNALGYITVVDFRLSDIVFIVRTLFPEESSNLKNLQSIQQTVYSLPEVKKYLSTGIKNAFPLSANTQVTLPGGK